MNKVGKKMSSILSELKQATLSIYSNNDEVVSNCFVVTFNADKDKKSIRPFLIFTNNSNITDDCYIALPVLDENGKTQIIKKKTFLGTLQKEFLIRETDVVAIPFAFMYNDLAKQNLSISFKSIQEELIFDEGITHKVSPYETLSFFSYEKIIDDYAYYNVRPISSINIEKPFFVDCARPVCMGFPVFIYNDAAYVENNSVNLGSRLFLVGVATSNNNGIIKIEPIDLVVKKIKKKFDFLSYDSNESK